MTFAGSAINFIKRVVVQRLLHMTRSDVLMYGMAGLLLALAMLMIVDGILFYKVALRSGDHVAPTSKNSLLSEAEVAETIALVNKRRQMFEQLLRASPSADTATTATTTPAQ